MLYKPQYFDLQELVCKHVYDKFGDTAWQFLDDRTLVVIDWLRRTLNKSISINTWNDGGVQTQSGLRCIQCDLVKSKCIAGEVYVSAHILGKAYDMTVEGMSAEAVRLWLAKNQDKIPYAIRLEKGVNWVHLDSEDGGQKVILFNP
jgi:hypothetical protein